MIGAPQTEGERQLLVGPITRETSYRLLVSGDVGPKELGKLIKLLKVYQEMLTDEDDEPKGEGRKDN